MLNLHLAQYIKKEMANKRRDRSSCSEDSLDQSRQTVPNKRRKTNCSQSLRVNNHIKLNSQSMTTFVKPDETAGDVANDAVDGLLANKRRGSARIHEVSDHSMRTRSKVLASKINGNILKFLDSERIASH